MGAPVRHKKKIDLICDVLSKRIVGNVWKIGSQIPTGEELAEEFKCSRGTVSKAIARLEGLRLLESRKRGGTLVTGNTLKQTSATIDLDALAFVFPNEQHEVIRRMMQGFQSAAAEVGRRVVMITTGTDYSKEAEVIGRLPEFDVRGCVTCPVVTTLQTQLHLSQILMASQIPIILAGMSLPGTRCPSVMMDGFHAGYTMTHYLIRRGLSRIGFLANHAWTQLAREKLLGYRRAMEEAGLAVQEDWIYLEDTMEPSHENPVREPMDVSMVYLKRGLDVEGVVCLNDFMAMGLCSAAREMGLRVPDDLKITGIDGIAFPEAGAFGLTSYRVPFEQIGRESLLLLEQILGGGCLNLRDIQLRGEIVVRQSA